MRPYIAHLQALSRNIETNGSAPSSFTLGASLGGSAPLTTILDWFSDRIDWYRSGIETLRGLLESNVQKAPDLAAGTQWFSEQVEELYQQAVGRSFGENLSYTLRRLAREGESDRRHELYSFFNTLARVHAEVGDPDVARRLFDVYVAHAAADPEAAANEFRIARLYQALSVGVYLPAEEQQRLLGETLSLYEHDEDGLNLDVFRVVWRYARLAGTPEARAHALTWIRRCLPRARTWLAYGCDHACALTEEHIRLLHEEAPEEMLLECETTLRQARRSRRLQHYDFTELWQRRGDLLRDQGRFRAAARSYGRCALLQVRRKDSTPPAAIYFHYATGAMYQLSGSAPAARKYLLKAHDLIDAHWEDDAVDTETCAAGVGLFLGRVGEEAKGETMLRRVLAKFQESAKPDPAVIARTHSLLVQFLQERPLSSTAS